MTPHLIFLLSDFAKGGANPAYLGNLSESAMLTHSASAGVFVAAEQLQALECVCVCARYIFFFFGESSAWENENADPI